MNKLLICCILVGLLNGCVATVPVDGAREKEVNPVGNESQDAAEEVKKTSPRKTSIFMGLLPQYVTSFEGPGYKVDVFQYVCQVSIAYRNTSSTAKAPQFKVLYTNGNQTVGEALAFMPTTLPGGESKAFALADVCRGRPTYMMYGGT